MILNSSSRLLLTGGTGSFGKYFLEKILNKFPSIERIVIYSRDELKQWELQQKYPPSQYPQIRFFIGDVRDKERLKRALEGIDIVIHAAALKQVSTAEYNPMEFVRTNVIGAENLIQASLDTSVKRVIALSTDKACAPVNLYGATKLCSDKLFIAANNIVGSRDVKYSVVRYGNVMGSRGSVIPLYLDLAKSGKLPITDISMTRFNITLQNCFDMVAWTINNCFGGEILVPKIPSYRILDLAEAIAPECSKEIIGVRPGEKIHEEMISTADSATTYELDNYYVILPNNDSIIREYLQVFPNCKKVNSGFSYNSGENNVFLSVEEIRTLIKDNLNPSFMLNKT